MVEGGSWTAGELARLLGGEVTGPAQVAILGVSSLDEAEPGQITFIADAAHARRWTSSRAAAAVVSRGLSVERDHRPLIDVDDAEIASIKLLELFAPAPLLPDPGIHPSACVHPDARIGSGCRIGPHVSVERGAELGQDVVLFPGVRIYAHVIIGDGSILHANCVVRERCRLGRRVIFHQGVAIGADGFGYRPDPGGRGLLKVPHLGIVIVEDDVEIGANSCVDRAKFGATVIGEGTKIDNLVQIAHNCRIGRACVIAGLCGLSGSVVLGDGVRLGGNVGIADHVTIGTGASIGAKAGVMADVAPGRSMLGCPAEESRTALRQIAATRKLPDLLRGLSSERDRPSKR